MLCATCRSRKARRGCPALRASICPVCCGTKRQVEIPCPPGCGWLHAAAAHPPAAQQRQAEDDQGRLRELLAGLTEPEYVVLTTCLHAMLQFRRTALPAPLDADVRDAAAALRATLETEARGLVYEHRPDAVVASRLNTVFRDALDRLEADGLPHPGPHAVGALRRLERMAGRMEADAQATRFLDFVQRVLRAPQDAERLGGEMAASALAALGRAAAEEPGEPGAATKGSRIILP